MQNLIIFIFFFASSVLSEDFCVIHNILDKNEKIINCNEKQLLFGYLEFKSRENALKFSFSKDLNEYVPLSYKSEILTFIGNNCYKKSLKIKTITNLDNKLDKYFNEIIIECRFKS